MVTTTAREVVAKQRFQPACGAATASGTASALFFDVGADRAAIRLVLRRVLADGGQAYPKPFDQRGLGRKPLSRGQVTVAGAASSPLGTLRWNHSTIGPRRILWQANPVIGHPAWVSADRCTAPYTVSKQNKLLYQLPDVSGAVESSAIKAAL